MISSSFLVVLLGATAASVAAVTTPSYVEEYKTWKLHPFKCWTDLRAYDEYTLGGYYIGQNRVLRDIPHGLNGNAMTVQTCLDACESAGYSLGGVEYGRECWCGNTARGPNYGEDYFPPYTKGRCSFPCTGNSSQICGGSAAINLYVRNNFPFTNGMNPHRIDATSGYYINQCWQDGYRPQRALTRRPRTWLDPTRMTVTMCVNACAADGWTSAGLEYGKECYCDNATYPIGQSQSVQECYMNCDGDATQFCGGPNRMLGYSTTPSGIGPIG